MGQKIFVAISLVAACSVEQPRELETLELGETEQHASVCADGPTVYGIDVSRFQGSIDWDKVAASGVKFAYIQISRHIDDLDAKFEYNWRRAKEVGILRGAYQRFHPGEPVDGQANIFLDKLGPYVEGDLPPMLDVEDDDGLPGTQVAAAVKQWMDKVEPAVGLKPLIYTGYYFWKDQVGSDAFGDHLLWIANYSAECPLVPSPWTRWAIHQYSSTANVPVTTENTTDVNKFNGTFDDLKALAKPVAPAACPIIDLAADPASGVVDDSSGCFSTGGPREFIRSEPAGIDGTLKWTHATDAATAANFGQWNLRFATAGRYKIEAHTPAPYNQSKQAKYKVTHDGKTTELVVDQSAADGWQTVGELTFAAGDGQSIRVDDNTGEPTASNIQIVFDALRFTPLDAPQPMPGGDDVSGGCSAGGATGAFAGLFVLGLCARRRRRAPWRMLASEHGDDPHHRR